MGAYFLKKQARSPILEGFGRNIYALLSFSGQQYFRMKDMYCWALDFPRTSADEAAWRYPKEKSSVVKAYKNYNKWVTNKTDLSWFDSTIPGNVDGSELY